MSGNDDFEDDLFADIYAEEVPPAQTAPKAPPPTAPVQEPPVAKIEPIQSYDVSAAAAPSSQDYGQSGHGDYGNDSSAAYDQYNGHDSHDNDDGYGPIGIKEDG